MKRLSGILLFLLIFGLNPSQKLFRGIATNLAFADSKSDDQKAAEEAAKEAEKAAQEAAKEAEKAAKEAEKEKEKGDDKDPKDPPTVPEPSTAVQFGAGALAILTAAYLIKRKRSNA